MKKIITVFILLALAHLSFAGETTRTATASDSPSETPSNSPSPVPSTAPSVSSVPSETPSTTTTASFSPSTTTTASESSSNSQTPSSTSTASLSPSTTTTASESSSNSQTPSSTSTASLSPSTTPTPTSSPSTTTTASLSSSSSLTPSTTPSLSGTSSTTPSNSETPSITPSTGASQSNTPTPSSTSSNTPTPSSTSSNTPTPSSTSSNTPSSSSTPSSVPSGSSAPSSSNTPTATPSSSVSAPVIIPTSPTTGGPGRCIAPPQVCSSRCQSEGGYDFVAVGYDPSSPDSQTLFRWTQGSISQATPNSNANPPYTYWMLYDYYRTASGFCANINPDTNPKLPSGFTQLSNATETHIALNSRGQGAIEFDLIGDGYTVKIGFYKNSALGLFFAQYQALPCDLIVTPSLWNNVNYTVEKPAGTVAETGIITCFQKRICGQPNYLFGCDDAQVCTNSALGPQCSVTNSPTPAPVGATKTASPTRLLPVPVFPLTNDSSSGGGLGSVISDSSSGSFTSSWINLL